MIVMTRTVVGVVTAIVVMGSDRDSCNASILICTAAIMAIATVIVIVTTIFRLRSTVTRTGKVLHVQEFVNAEANSRDPKADARAFSKLHWCGSSQVQPTFSMQSGICKGHTYASPKSQPDKPDPKPQAQNPQP